jgi:hypothetical protein
VTPLWTYPEGHEPDWLDLSGDPMTGADSEEACALHAAEAERDNVLAECRFLRVLCLVLVAALVGVLGWGL